MPTPRFSDAELRRFGVEFDDEHAHDFDPAVEWWNESWFWDWYDAEGNVAGHCRIGIHPNQNRVWVWLFAYRDGEWIVIEEPRLPLAAFDRANLAYDSWGLRFGWRNVRPLRGGNFRFDGFGRVVSGPRTGMIQAVGADLTVSALGPPHSLGRARASGHSSESYPASRFEQPIALEGNLRFGDDEVPFRGHGERDHSWGPRHWNLEWTLLVLNSDAVRMQCALGEIPGAGTFPGGYLLRQESSTITQVDFDVSLHEDDVQQPISGRFAVKTEDGDSFSGEIEALTAAEMDITHTLVPPQRSLYRRALIRVRPDDGSDPSLGWIEFNRLRENP
jgi:hypothetical protein